MAKINYTGGVIRNIKVKLSKAILNAQDKNPENKKEIRRVFQMANRRIQNIERTEEFSPALIALNKETSGYTKFSMNQTWVELKKSYSQAVSFLNQPTSTAAGTRQYNDSLKNRYDLTDLEYSAIADRFRGKLTSLSGSSFVEKYLMRYKDFTGELEAEASSLSSQIESEAKQIEQALQDDLKKESDDIAERLLQDTVEMGRKLENDYNNGKFDNIMKGFKM